MSFMFVSGAGSSVFGAGRRIPASDRAFFAGLIVSTILAAFVWTKKSI
jgi:hypothetical protein